MAPPRLFRESTLLVGIGHPFRGDDAAGLLTAEAIAKCCPGLAVIRHAGDGAELLDVWAGWESVILIDAICSGAMPGAIRRWDGSQAIPRALFGVSSHNVGVGESLELARMLNRLPRYWRLYGIEGRQFNLGAPVSREVRASVARLSEEITGLFDSKKRSPAAGVPAAGISIS